MEALVRQWFASADEIRDMHAGGMTIGLHGISHRSLQMLGTGVADEIREASAWVAQLTGVRSEWWACPFGGSGAGPEALAAMNAALDEVGVRAAVSTVKTSVPTGAILGFATAGLHRPAAVESWLD